jgi:hypothetical protein
VRAPPVRRARSHWACLLPLSPLATCKGGNWQAIEDVLPSAALAVTRKRRRLHPGFVRILKACAGSLNKQSHMLGPSIHLQLQVFILSISDIIFELSSMPSYVFHSSSARSTVCDYICSSGTYPDVALLAFDARLSRAAPKYKIHSHAGPSRPSFSCAGIKIDRAQ